MAKIGMYKPTGKKPPPLPLLSNCGRVKNKVVNDLLTAESTYGDKRGNDDDDKCN